jgi:hypothetical protein
MKIIALRKRENKMKLRLERKKYHQVGSQYDTALGQCLMVSVPCTD